MITSLMIKNLAIIDSLELEFESAMTALTGETGAGKSILIGALNIALGQRAEQNLIKHHAHQAEVIVVFNIQKLVFAKNWLNSHDIEHDGECILRRIIKSNGSSRALVNGVQVTLSDLQTLSESLVSIHSQHAHHQLLNLDMQRQILDSYGKHDLTPLQNCLKEIHAAKEKIRKINVSEDPLFRLEYLQHQLHELGELNAEEEDWQLLCAKQKQLAQLEKLTQCLQITDQLIDGDKGAVQQMHHAINTLYSIEGTFPKITQLNEMFNTAITLCQEASSDLSQMVHKIQLDGDELTTIEDRMSRWHELARKHKVSPEKLPRQKNILEDEYNLLANAQDYLIALEKDLSQLQAKRASLAEKLHQQRKETAVKLTHSINIVLKKLHLPPTLNIEVSLDNKNPDTDSHDRIIFTFQPNIGHPAQQLHKTASGGELSRLSLAIAVCVTSSVGYPSLIFDEVDTGIGGETAETVGKLLKTLSKNAQVFVITHQAQVAAQAQNHFKISKEIESNQTITKIKRLSKEQRIQEVSRMIGGASISAHAIAHATEILSSQHEHINHHS